MNDYSDYRPRLSIVLDEQTFKELNEIVGDLRIKNLLYKKITEDLIRIAKKLKPEHQKYLLLGIIEGSISITEYLPGLKSSNIDTNIDTNK